MANRSGSRCLVYTEQWFNRLRRELLNQGMDIFATTPGAKQLLVGVVQNLYDWTKPSAEILVRRLDVSTQAKSFLLLELSAFSEMIRRELAGFPPMTHNLVYMHYEFDDHVITTDFVKRGREGEFRFEDYIHRCREEGKHIPVEFDRLYDDFASTLPQDLRVHLSDLRREMAETRRSRR